MRAARLSMRRARFARTRISMASDAALGALPFLLIFVGVLGFRVLRQSRRLEQVQRDKNETTKTFSEVLVRKNQLPVWEVYDLSQGVELGRGACGRCARSTASRACAPSSTRS